MRERQGHLNSRERDWQSERERERDGVVREIKRDRLTRERENVKERVDKCSVTE